MSIPLEALQTFVQQACHGRDESHGYSHMATVAKVALELARSERIFDSHILNRVQLVGYLHDVNDHKYDHDGCLELAIRHFLRGYLSAEEVNRILAIVGSISFSKENQYRQQFGHSPRKEWLSVLGEDGLVVRDLVSDADKLEALGEIGYQRCYQYAREHSPHLPESGIRKQMQEHFQEKLGRLAEEFLVTNAAQQRGHRLTQELRSRIFN